MTLKPDPRHNARKLALSALFCWIFTDTGSEEAALLNEELLDASAETDTTLTDQIVEGVKRNIEEIDSIIQNAAPEWPIEKIAKVDLVILRIAIFEVLMGKRTPVKVAIDEAVELAKEFGNDTSHKFVNGVLGTVVDKYNNRINK